MSRKYKRVTTDIDPERGNAVTIYREDVAPLVKSLPTEVTAPIIDAFIRWFCDVAEPEIKNALARAMLEQFKERQREAVKGYIAICNSRTRPTDGERQVEISGDKSLNKRNIKNEVNVNETSVLYGDASVTPSGGDSTPTASPPTAVIGRKDVVDARKVLARFAPTPKFELAFSIGKCDGRYTTNDNDDKHNIDTRAKISMEKVKALYLENNEKWNEEHCWLQVSREAYNSNYGKHWDDDYVAKMFIGRTDNASLRATWRKYHDTLGDSTFLNAIWTLLIDRFTDNIPAADKDGNQTNYGKLLFGRLKKLVDAKAILAQYDSERKQQS